MAAYRLRRATVHDVDALVHQRRGMWIDYGQRDVRALDAADRVYRRWARSRLRSKTLVGFVVGTRSGEVVAGGCVWLQEVQPRPGFPGGPQPYLLSMYTEPAHRRKGLATRIVREAVRWCRAHGHPRFALHASPAGRPVYAKLGFERTWEMRLEFPRPRGDSPKRSQRKAT